MSEETAAPKDERKQAKRDPGLRQLPDGRWRFRIYTAGRKDGPRKQTTLPRGTRYADALKAYKAAVARAAARQGRPIPRRLTFKDAADEYLAVQRGRLAAGTVYGLEATIKNHLLPTFGRRPVEDIRPSDVSGYQTKRLEEGARSSSVNLEVSRFLAIIRKMVSFGWVDRDPLPRGAVALLPTPAQKTDYFRPEEWRAFIAALEERRPEAVTAFRALLLTAARVGELASLVWSGVDLEGKRITFTMSKRRGAPKTLPISDELAEILEALPRGVGEARVFTRPDGSAWTVDALQAAFYSARDAAKIRKGLSVHSVRHSAASWQAQAGIPIQQIQASLGHSSLRQTSRYTHLQPEHLTNAVETIASVEKSGQTAARRHLGATKRG